LTKIRCKPSKKTSRRLIMISRWLSPNILTASKKHTKLDWIPPAVKRKRKKRRRKRRKKKR